MKIVHCFFIMTTGGAQVLAIDMLNEMCAENEVSLVIVNNRWKEELIEELDKRVKIFFIKREEGSRNPFPVVRLNFLLRRLQPDVVHCHEPNMSKLIRFLNYKLLYTIHDVGIDVQLYSLYDGLVAISDAVYKDVQHKVTKPLTRIYNGIPVHKFSKRNNYTVDKNTVMKLVQLSRLEHTKKGQAVLLQALHTLVHEWGVTNVSLDFIGNGSSKQYLIELVKEYKLEGYVNFIGEKDRAWLFDALCTYHILVQPSLYEGFGLTIVEALAAGVPVLASAIDGPAEIISQLPGGFLFDQGGAVDCAKQLVKMIGIYQQNDMKQFMQPVLPAVQQTFSIQACSTAYLAAYKSILHPQKNITIQPASFNTSVHVSTNNSIGLEGSTR